MLRSFTLFNIFISVYAHVRDYDDDDHVHDRVVRVKDHDDVVDHGDVQGMTELLPLQMLGGTLAVALVGGQADKRVDK